MCDIQISMHVSIFTWGLRRSYKFWLKIHWLTNFCKICLPTPLANYTGTNYDVEYPKMLYFMDRGEGIAN